MTFAQRKEAFDRQNPVAHSTLLTFHGVEGYDVYNCSIPFTYEGKRYLFGRVERRNEWARSWSRLFEQVDEDEYALVPGDMIYQLEDPFISCIRGEWVLGGTHVRYQLGELDTYYGYFYKGADVHDLYYFTTGPDRMKDIRLVELEGGIGVFSRPRGPEIVAQHGSESIVGFTMIDDLMQLSADVVQHAPKVEGLFAAGEWGGCNQAYRLDTGLVGIIGHKSFLGSVGGEAQNVYVNVSFVMDPKNNTILDEKIIATRSSYPDAPAKRPSLRDCAFTSGIVPRADGMVDLYSGLGDTCQGRAVIEDPFRGFGRIVKGV